MPALSKKQQKFFGIVRSIQKGEQTPTTPETAKAAADMKKGDVKKFASTKHKGLPEKKVTKEAYGNPNVGPALKLARLEDDTHLGVPSPGSSLAQVPPVLTFTQPGLPSLDLDPLNHLCKEPSFIDLVFFFIVFMNFR